MPLRDEGTDVWVMVPAIERNGEYEILPTTQYGTYGEVWAFPPGSVVRCREQDVAVSRALVAFEKIR